jgi:hypothetical protein
LRAFPASKLAHSDHLLEHKMAQKEQLSPETFMQALECRPENIKTVVQITDA